jgi:hypothetical protein
VTELRLLAEYGLTERIALQVAVPFRIVDTRTRYTDLDGDPIQLDYESIHHRDETLARLGDVQLLAHAATARAGFALGGRAGVSVPTGIVHENPYRLGAEGRSHEHIQFGTGTIDPVAAVDLGRTRGPWSVSGFGQAQLVVAEGRRGFQAGSRFLGGLTGSRATAVGAVRLGLTVAHERPERWDGRVPEEDGNRGRTDLFVGPGITIPFAVDYSASVDVGIRVYGHAVGAQLDMPVVVSLSLGRLVHLERGPHVEPLPASPSTAADLADAVLEGEAAPLVPVAGKWTIFDFWATWCEACGTLDRRLRDYVAGRPDVALRRVNIVDLGSPIARRELGGVTTLPHVRLIGPDGRQVWEASGTPAELIEGIRARCEPDRPTTTP